MNKMNEVKPLGNLALEVVVQWEQRYVSAKPNKRICRVTSSLFLPTATAVRTYSPFAV